MNIKSLLLGSAAALVAVSGARAADAVVIAEPEPMEYVRVCDTYGVGFYYIPGTETCIKVSGYIRYDIGIGARGHEDVFDKSDLYDLIEDGDDEDGFDTNDTYYKRARFALRVDARSETELGTLRAYAQVNFNYTTNTDGLSVLGVNIDPSALSPELYGITTSRDSVSIDHAYIELGGFRVGKTDSYFTTFTGYAGGVISDDLVGYGPFGTHQMAYTWNGGNGFTAGVALETGAGFTSFSGLVDPSAPAALLAVDIYAIDSYMPHVVGGIGYVGGWGGVSVVAGYDSVWEEGAVKGRIDFTANDALSLFLMAGWLSTEGFNYYAPWGGDWAVWGGGTWKFNEKTAMNVQLSYDEVENFAAVANVAYELVPNFTITPEISYTDNFDTDDSDAWGGFLRFERNFGG